jgi:hypothetical protein
MSRSMGAARKAYITQIGTPATDMVDIFDPVGPELVSTIEQQAEFHKKWVHSLRK